MSVEEQIVNFEEQIAAKEEELERINQLRKKKYDELDEIKIALKQFKKIHFRKDLDVLDQEIKAVKKILEDAIQKNKSNIDKTEQEIKNIQDGLKNLKEKWQEEEKKIKDMYILIGSKKGELQYDIINTGYHRSLQYNPLEIEIKKLEHDLKNKEAEYQKNKKKISDIDNAVNKYISQKSELGKSNESIIKFMERLDYMIQHLPHNFNKLKLDDDGSLTDDDTIVSLELLDASELAALAFYRAFDLDNFELIDIYHIKTISLMNFFESLYCTSTDNLIKYLETHKCPLCDNISHWINKCPEKEAYWKRLFKDIPVDDFDSIREMDHKDCPNGDIGEKDRAFLYYAFGGKLEEREFESRFYYYYYRHLHDVFYCSQCDCYSNNHKQYCY